MAILGKIWYDTVSCKLEGKTVRRLANSISTIEKLNRAFLSALREKEYCDVTITELSERAEINRTTFYLFYGSKDELFRDLCSALVDQWFQRFFDLNITKWNHIENVEAEKELFRRLLGWIRQWAPALKRVFHVRTDTFDGFTLLTAGIEQKMKAQSVFRTDDEMKRMSYALFIKIYSVGLISILKWWLEEGENFEENAVHTMIERLRFKGYYSILDNEQD